jgi:hypothetical protein
MPWNPSLIKNINGMSPPSQAVYNAKFFTIYLRFLNPIYHMHYRTSLMCEHTIKDLLRVKGRMGKRVRNHRRRFKTSIQGANMMTFLNFQSRLIISAQYALKYDAGFEKILQQADCVVYERRVKHKQPPHYESVRLCIKEESRN